MNGLRAIILVVATMLPQGAGVCAEPVRAGWTELISFPRLGMQLPAKLDTGAKTSALDGQNLERFQRDGGDWIRFTLTTPAGGNVRLERRILRLAKIRRAGVATETRPVVAMLVCVAGIRRRTEFTVNDRRGMAYPVLLGRRFLAGRIVVDAASRNLTTGACSRATPDQTEPAERG